MKDDSSKSKATSGLKPSFAHDLICGRIDCSLCGARAFSRSARGIRAWKIAHEKCCKQHPRPATVRSVTIEAPNWAARTA